MLRINGAMQLASICFLDQLDGRVHELVHVPGADVAAVVDDDVDVAPTLEDRRGGGAERCPVQQVGGNGEGFGRRPRGSGRPPRRGCPEAATGRSPAASMSARAASPGLTVRAVMATSKPAWARSMAQTRPIPRLAPVMKATFRSNVRSFDVDLRCCSDLSDRNPALSRPKVIDNLEPSAGTPIDHSAAVQKLHRPRKYLTTPHAGGARAASRARHRSERTLRLRVTTILPVLTDPITGGGEHLSCF